MIADLEFHGWRDITNQTNNVTVRTGDNPEEANLPLYLHELDVYEGFEWGRRGQGRMRLAYSILRFYIEHVHDFSPEEAGKKAKKLMSQFMSDVICDGLELSIEWKITSDFINTWISKEV